MDMYRLVLTVLALTLMPAMALAQAVPGQPLATIDDKSQQVLGAMSDHFAKLNGFAVAVNVKSQAKVAGREQNSTAKLTYVIRRPNQFDATYQTDESTGGRIMADGKELVMYLPQFKQYTKTPQNPNQPLAHDILGMLLNGALVTDNPINFLRMQVESISYVGKEKAGQFSAHHLRFGVDGAAVDLWLTDQPKPAPMRMLVDRSKAVTQQTGQPAKVIADITYTGWQFNPKLAKDRFEFKAPDGVRLVRQIQPPTAEELVGQPAPDFELKTLDGKTVRLRDFKGKKAVVLDFWATWCGPCLVGLPAVQQVAEAAGDDVVFFAINKREDADTIKAFLKQHNFDPTVLLDTDNKVSDAYNAFSIPQSVFINKKGIVTSAKTGIPRASSMEEARMRYRKSLAPDMKKMLAE
jgi:thiol-disulfide isomerase/thioredoxin/outer membrane lipoprotein-sorting protein